MTEKGFAIWLTGLPGCGKSTIAKALIEKLGEKGISAQILESDELRRVLTPKPTYSPQERETFYNSMVYIGKLLVDNGINVIFDATANKRKFRDWARRSIDKFLEVYVKCPLKVCIRRDPKGIYKKAKEGKSHTVPGLQVKYEAPRDPEVIIYSDKETAQEGAKKIVVKLMELL